MKKSKDSKIGLGMAAIGRPKYINLRQEASLEISMRTFRENGLATLEAAYMQGVRYFDTAPGYGMAEQILVDFIKEKKALDIEVATKWGYTYVANFNPNATQHEVKEHSLKKLNEQWNESEILLPQLTSYQIHSATFETRVLNNEAVLHRLAELQNEHGLLMGISTSGVHQKEVLKKALDTEVNGKSLFDVFQVTYNVFDQSISSIASEISKQNKRLVIKEALANGRIFSNKKYIHYATIYKRLKELSNKYDVGVDAIALRFCIDSIPIYKVLSGATNETHLIYNLKANDIKLEKRDIDDLKKVAVSPDFYWRERKQLDWN